MMTIVHLFQKDCKEVPLTPIDMPKIQDDMGRQSLTCTPEGLTYNKTMQPNDLAHLLGTTGNSVRRWTTEFYKYLTPQASPPKGKPRIYSEHDQRVLHFVAACRDNKQSLETIHARLESMQGNDWRGLPDVPPEWREKVSTMPVALAASKAYDFAQMAVLQRELEYTRAELQTAQTALEAAQQRVLDLETAMNAQQALQQARDGELQAQLHAAYMEAEKARGQVAALEARLSAYAITGGSSPIPVALIIAVTALAAVVIVALVFVLARLLVG